MKLENIVINPLNNQIKLLDFGFSCYKTPDIDLTTRVGTPYYIAPEVLTDGYGLEADMWSIGVISYILLVGSPPFHSARVSKILYKIVNSPVRYDSEIWEKLSIEAFDFVSNILIKNPKERMKPAAGLKHDWIKQKISTDHEISSDVIANLVKYQNVDTLKREIFIILMNNMNSDTKVKWNKYFEALDVDQDGHIKINVLIENLDDFECNPGRRKKLKKLLEKRKDITIDYTDFLTKVIDVGKVFTEEDIENTFKYFDTQNKGTIDLQDISSHLGRKAENVTIDDALCLINNVDNIKDMDFTNLHDSENDEISKVDDTSADEINKKKGR